jgi:hypothetical protein
MSDDHQFSPSVHMSDDHWQLIVDLVREAVNDAVKTTVAVAEKKDAFLRASHDRLLAAAKVTVEANPGIQRWEALDELRAAIAAAEELAP